MSVKSMVAALTSRRTELGISQRRLDDIMGVSQCMTAKWESGARVPTATSLQKWAQALGLKVQLVQPPLAKKRKS